MIDDLDHLDDGLTMEADICIIGSGIAGLTIAREFLGTGTRVVIVETGGPTMEDKASELNRGEVSGLAFAGLQEGRARAYGGTSNLWGGQCIPLDPIDFEERPWVPASGWPVAATEIAPYYERAKRLMWIPSDEYETSVWERFGLDPVALDPAVLHIAHTIFIARHNIGQRYRSELQAAPNIHIVLHANAIQLDTGASGARIRRVRIRSLGGRSGSVAARIVILCAGAIENARLLLVSDQTSAEGLGNQNGNVGRYLQDHPVCRCATVETRDPRRLQDHFNLLYGTAARTLRFGHGTKYLPKMALSEIVQRRQQVLNCVGQLEYEYNPGSPMQALRDLVVALHMGQRPGRLLSTTLTIALASPLLVRNAVRFAARGLTPAVQPARIHLQAISEQAPDPDSRITLSDKVDLFGLRQARVHWQMQSIDWRTLLVFSQSVQAEFARLELGDVTIADWLVKGDPSSAPVRDSFHMAGTTRMARSPTMGVVDTNCQVFGVQGLYAAGTSVFPTSGAVNPVLTITALSVRLADHLKVRLRSSQTVLMPVPA